VPRNGHLPRVQPAGQSVRSWARRRGYERGDALAFASGNSIEFLVTYYAYAKLGVVCVPVNLGWRPDEVGYVLGHSRSRGIVIESQLVPLLAEVISKQEGVADVIVAPGTDGEAGLRSGDIEGAVTFADLLAADDAEPESIPTSTGGTPLASAGPCTRWRPCRKPSCAAAWSGSAATSTCCSGRPR
jgi:acyl-CoA synthetase (AMP-forming)/AMP-acid ligase II